MNEPKDETDLLLEAIRKEIVAIVNESPNDTQPQPDPDQPINSNSDRSEKKLPQTKSKSGTVETHKLPHITIPAKDTKDKNVQKPAKPQGQGLSSKDAVSSVEMSEQNAADRLSELPIDDIEKLFASENAKNSEFIESEVSKSIDEDLIRMRLSLSNSYELFQSVGNKLDNIDFTGLKKRIKDSQLTPHAGNDPSAVSDLKLLFDKSYMDNRLKEMTDDVKGKLRNHPGEFGDIPELSEYMKTCSQLERGLETLKKQRMEVKEISKRMSWAADVSFNRIDEIMNAVNSTNSQMGDS